MKKSRVQPVLRWLHQWVGITLGTVFVAAALSGTLLLFQPQLFRLAHGEMIPPGMSQRQGPVDQWIENARAAVPELEHLIVIWPPHFSHNVSDAGMLLFGGRQPGGLGQTGFAAVLVAPETGKVLGVVDVDRSPAYAPIFFHSTLWVGESGRVLLGIVAVGSALLVAVGFYLWWPGRKRLAQQLSPRPLRNLKFAGRLHHWLGGWIGLVLLILAITGIYMVRPAWVEPILATLPAEHAAPQPPASACGAPMTLEQAKAKAQALVPGSTWGAIEPQDSSPQHWEIVLRPGHSSAPQRETHTLVDLSCGTAAIEATPATRAARDSTEMWLTGLHDGKALGRGGEIFVAVAGLAPLVLFWSGLRTWLRSRKSIRSASSR